jgi:peptidoglycan endopeptidase LytE
VGKGQRIFLFFFVLFVFSCSYAFSAVTHKVKSGDTLQSISKKYRVSVDNLKSFNGLNTTRLKIGQVLVVSPDAETSVRPKEKGKAPANRNQRTMTTAGNEANDAFIRYKVEKGDTVESLAERFDLEEDGILEFNNLKKKRLTPGKLIRIPRPEGSETEEFVALNAEPGKSLPLKKWKGEEERGMLVKVAKSFSGAPYHYGGDSVRGLDCSAYVKKIYEIFEVQLPRCAREQYYAGLKIPNNELTTGDLVFFRTKKHLSYPTHVGIYIGDDKFIHASSYLKQGVKINALSEDYYAKRFIGGVRVKTLPADSSDAARHSSTDPSNS